jgi:aspartyl-tRNA(Asn)/glutamyl-tRNA(Gln) amidotransferase subunit B
MIRFVSSFAIKKKPGTQRPPYLNHNRRKSSSENEYNLVYDRDSGIVSRSNSHDDSSSHLKPLFRSVIGIEIHAQLKVPTKLFSSGPTKHHPSFKSEANASVSLHDIAYPGTLPLLSISSVRNAIISAAALNCVIQETSRFERKHYNYADLPLGYQVTQQRWPLAKEGMIICRRYIPPPIKKSKGTKSRRNKEHVDYGPSITNTTKSDLSKFFEVGIDRIQLEQDTGKTTAVSSDGSTRYLIDFNRAGSTLIEIVFKPQIFAAHEAASVVSTLQSLLRYLGTCDGKMEEGSLRCDLNVSVCPVSCDSDDSVSSQDDDVENPFHMYLPKGVGQRVEVKNLNSLKQIIHSTEYEALRQSALILNGRPTKRETRTFDPKSGRTIKIRDKDGAVDYRFMPEPDLPPLRLDKNILGKNSLQEFLNEHLPELPEQVVRRLMNDYGISEASALIITSDRPLITFFEDAVSTCAQELEKKDHFVDQRTISTAIANWLCNDLLALAKESTLKDDNNHEQESEGTSYYLVEHFNVDAPRLGSLVSLVLDQTVSTTQAKKLLNVMYQEDRESSPLDIAERNGWRLITDMDTLKCICQKVVLDATNEKQLEQYKMGGKHIQKMTKYFTGKIMAESGGNAHPELMAKALQEVLEKVAPGTV